MTLVAEYPKAIVWEAHPSNVGVGTNNPKVIVYHTPEEPADGYPGTPYWFAREHPGSEGSTHYFDSYLGFIWQCVKEDARAIANGVTANKSYPAGTNSNISLNLQSISIEIEGYAATIGQTLSVAQHKALVDWTVYACKKYNIPADRQHIIGHYEVASNRSDPGTLPIDSIVAEVKAILEGDNMDPLLEKRLNEFFVAPYTDIQGRIFESKATYMMVVADWLDNVHLSKLFDEHKKILEQKSGTGAHVHS